MRYFDVNGETHLYNRHTGSVSVTRSGFEPMSEVELLRNLAAAVERKHVLEDAIADMKLMLEEMGNE